MPGFFDPRSIAALEANRAQKPRGFHVCFRIVRYPAAKLRWAFEADGCVTLPPTLVITRRLIIWPCAARPAFVEVGAHRFWRGLNSSFSGGPHSPPQPFADGLLKLRRSLRQMARRIYWPPATPGGLSVLKKLRNFAQPARTLLRIGLISTNKAIASTVRPAAVPLQTVGTAILCPKKGKHATVKLIASTKTNRATPDLLSVIKLSASTCANLAGHQRTLKIVRTGPSPECSLPRSVLPTTLA
jgi:hypothetical protein